jgi:hypothetical protein
MQTYVRVLKQLVRESRYIVDERAVAEAILTRARIRLTRGAEDAGRSSIRLRPTRTPGR